MKRAEGDDSHIVKERAGLREAIMEAVFHYQCDSGQDVMEISVLRTGEIAHEPADAMTSTRQESFAIEMACSSALTEVGL